MSSTPSGLIASWQTRHAGEACSRSQKPHSRWHGDGHALLLRLPRVLTCWYGDVRLRGPDKAIGEACIPILHANCAMRYRRAASRRRPDYCAEFADTQQRDVGGRRAHRVKHCERRRQDVAPDSGEALRRREVASPQRLTGQPWICRALQLPRTIPVLCRSYRRPPAFAANP